jgi:hypothetical protein
MKKYVVFTSPMTPAQEGKFALNLSGMEWWHYIPGCWLIADPKEKFDSRKLRKILEEIDPNLDCGIFPVDPKRGWATRLDTGVAPTSKDWLESNWVPAVEVGG